MLNLVLRFVLELALLAAFGYWGFKTGGRLPARWLLGIGVPLLAAMIWGMFLSPKASLPLEAPLRLAIELVLFGLAAAALYASGHPGWAAALPVLWAVNRTLMAVWHQ